MTSPYALFTHEPGEHLPKLIEGDLLGRVLNILRKVLAVHIEKRLKLTTEANDDWKRVAFSCGATDIDRDAPRDAASRAGCELHWDIASTFNAVFREWEKSFKNAPFTAAERALLFELQRGRNLWAHQRAETLPTEDLYRMFDDAERILRALVTVMPEVEETMEHVRTARYLLVLRFANELVGGHDEALHSNTGRSELMTNPPPRPTPSSSHTSSSRTAPTHADSAEKDDYAPMDMD